jgi:hypothetical protein
VVHVRAVYACPPALTGEDKPAFYGEPCASESCSNTCLAPILGLDSAGRFHGPYCHLHQHTAVIEPLGLKFMDEREMGGYIPPNPQEKNNE